PLQLVSYSFGLPRLEHLIQGPYSMYVQIVSNQHYTFSIREVFICQLLELSSETARCAVLRHLNPSPPPQRLTRQKDVGSAFSFVFVFVHSFLTWFGSQRLSLRVVR